MSSISTTRELKKDIVFIGIGFVCAFILAQLGFLDMFVDVLGGGVVASFISGILFTSVFTLGPASIALTHISAYTPLLSMALWGGLGALCGDLLLFFFVRDRFAADLMRVLKPSFAKHLVRSFHIGFLKWLSPVIGAVIIASPLPDELGVMLMGFSRTRLIVLIPIAFCMNVLGIYMVGWFAQHL